MDSMDYFLYKKGVAQYWTRNYARTRRVLRVTCPTCATRIWGVWEFSYEIDKRDGRTWYCTKKAEDCFNYGIRYLQDHEGLENISKPDLPYREIDGYRREAISFTEIEECPVCAGKLSKHDMVSWGDGTNELFGVRFGGKIGTAKIGLYNPSYASECSLDTVLKATRAAIKENGINKGNRKYERLISQYSDLIVPETKYLIQGDAQLKDFLEHLVNVEKNIYAVSKRLQELYCGEDERELFAKHSSAFILAETKKEVSALYKELQKLQNKKIASVIKYPPEPVAPKAPKEPILKKPGLFSKKRVMAQNAVLMEQYENACEQYAEALKEYSEKTAAYNEEVKRIKDEHERELIKAKNAHEEECRELEQLYLSEKQAYDKLVESGVTTEEVLIKKAADKEIKQAEQLLKELYQIRKQMYEGGVIFGKYHNFVAISSFYEYLSSGRCSSLEGPKGAYNLYENEVRMNTVISQLSTIIEKLEEIKNNQYVIYSAIKESTKQLKKLNSTMEQISIFTKNIEYNTAVSAFYSKKNAELTDALCFLTALS